MDLSNPAIRSYTSNQNLSGWAQETGQVSPIEALQSVDDLKLDDDVTLSNQAELIDWVAQTLPLDTTDTAKIVRAAQWMFEYGNLEMSELKTLNSTLTRYDNANVTEALNDGLTNSETLSERLSHQRLIQMFSTLAAAAQ